MDHFLALRNLHYFWYGILSHPIVTHRVIGAYGSDASIPGSGYDPGADFNGDGFVDSTDFGLLIGNFGAMGDP